MTALHDAARQAALDARDRLGARISDYTALTIAEAAIAVIEGRVVEWDAPDVVDADSMELPFGDDLEARHRAIDVHDRQGLLQDRGEV